MMSPIDMDLQAACRSITKADIILFNVHLIAESKDVAWEDAAYDFCRSASVYLHLPLRRP